MVRSDIEDHVARFMDGHVDAAVPCILGFSGGVDSSALLHLLHRSAAVASHPVHVVHVDHGWRQESAAEAAMLEKRVSSLGIPFTCFRLPSCPAGENIEDWSRRQRMACFSTVASSLGTSIILLAHQADDQAEVVFKRFLEGASLTKFRGMRPVERIGGLTLIRPLLAIRRAALLSYLHDRSLPYLQDPTNTDTSYLRARMRETIFPYLRQTFGKEFDNSILRVANESADLELYLHEQCARSFSIHNTPDAAFATPRGEEPPAPFLARCLVDHLKESLCLQSFSRHQVEAAVEAFCGKPSGVRRFFVGRGGLFAESGFFAAFREKLNPIEVTLCDEQEGRTTVGSWEVTWKLATAVQPEQKDWKELFSGALATWYIPPHPFCLCPTTDRLIRTIKSHSRRSPHIVSLRPFIPSCVQSFRLVADPLSGYTVPLPIGSVCYAVTMRKLESVSAL